MGPTSVIDLWLMRHAKSSWNNANLTDFERPLNDRGKRDAPVMARRLHEITEEIDLILTSSAVRALSTAEIVSARFPKAELQQTDRLYLASASQIVEHLAALDSNLHRVLLVAHNPGLEELVRRWSDDSDAEMPTAAIAHFRIPKIQWSELPMQKHLALHSLIKPKDENHESLRR